jgi:hypothetical protein
MVCCFSEDRQICNKALDFLVKQALTGLGLPTFFNCLTVLYSYKGWQPFIILFVKNILQ